MSWQSFFYTGIALVLVGLVIIFFATLLLFFAPGKAEEKLKVEARLLLALFQLFLVQTRNRLNSCLSYP